MQTLVQQGDTLERIALRTLGNASFADLLAQTNSLDYPFVVGDPAFVKQVYAAGQVTLTALTSASVTILVGATVQTAAGSSNETRSYLTTQETILSALGQTATVNVQASVPGSYGNALANTVTVSGSSAYSVTNVAPITGGRILRVLTPGDLIFIPGATTATATNQTARLTLAQYDDSGGVDLLLTPQHGFLFSDDDLLATDGADTIGGDVAATYATPLRSVADDPTFGSLIPSTIGLGGEFTLQRLAVLAQGTAIADSRVQQVGAVSVSQTGTWATVSVPLKLRTGQTQAQVAVSQGGIL